MCGFGIQKETTRPHRFDLLYQNNPQEWHYWMYDIGFGHIFDYIGFKWQQPMTPGEKSWISKKEMQAQIDAKKSARTAATVTDGI